MGRLNIQLDMICALKVHKCEFSVYTYGLDFYEMHARLCGPTNLLTFRQIINRT